MFDSFYNNPGLTYGEAFAYEFFCTDLVYAFSTLLGSYALYGIALLIKRTIKNRYSALKPAEMNGDIYLDSSVQELRENLNVSVKTKGGPKHIIVQIILILSTIASWYSFLCFAVAPSILSGLGVIPVWSSVILTLLLFLIKYIGLIYTLAPNYLNKNQEGKSFLARFWRKVTVTSSLRKLPLGAFLAVGLVYSVAVPLMTMGTCMNFYNQGYGVQFQDFGLSTAFSRHLELDTVCPEGQICHLYSTLPEDGSTSIILNVHTGDDVSSIQIGYGPIIEGSTDPVIDNIVTAQSFYIDIEDRGDRFMHSAYLYGLTPNTKYAFEIYFNGLTQQTGAFTTLPTPGMERPLLMAAGGDVGTTQDAQEMTGVLANYSLDAILVGGDLGYDNGIRSCYYSLDRYLSFFEDLNNKAGRLIPMIVSVGNHDVGFNAFQGTQIDVSRNLYFTYFPQHSTTDGNGNLTYRVPELADRLSYAYHVVGNTVHLSLDSNYIMPTQGVQTDFITNVSTNFSSLVKFANFHVPMYPTCFSADYDDPRTLSEPRAYWAPLFEQYNFASVFENHVHLYKKSFPIINGKGNSSEGAKGVVYFGDGNWGISPDVCFDIPGALNGNDTGVLEVFQQTRHVWLINITNVSLSHFAVNENNVIFDKVYELPVESYQYIYEKPLTFDYDL